MQDFQTKRGRLQKKYPLSYFRKELDNIASYGAEPKLTLSTFEKVLYTLVAVGVVVYVAQALMFIF